MKKALEILMIRFIHGKNCTKERKNSAKSEQNPLLKER
jgi:hypothetical protein